MTTDKMREKARDEAWRSLRFESESGFFWDVDGFQMFDAGYDTATQQSTAKIAQMQTTIDEQLLIITSLNNALGGEGSLTTDNFVTLGRLETELEAYRTMQRTDNSAVIANMQARIDELEGAIENLKSAKGRYNTEIACNKLYEALAKVKN